MRTLSFVLGGIVLLAACLGIAKVMPAGSMRLGTVVFLVVWLVVAAGNMWVGVSKAGCAVAEGFPIFLLIFGLPAIVAVLVNWKFS
jgi:hypothetical protein